MAHSSKNQILLKQYAREQIESLLSKKETLLDSHHANLKVLLKELIDLKKQHAKDQHILDLIQKKQPSLGFRERLMQELRTFVSEQILPQLLLDDLGEQDTA